MILEILRCQILKDIKTFLDHIKVYPVSLQRRIYEPIPCETAKINELAPKYKKKKKHLTTTWILRCWKIFIHPLVKKLVSWKGQ